MELRVVVDSRIRVCVAGPGWSLDAQTAALLKGVFEHTNPEHAKKRRLGLPLWNVPKVIRTWGEGEADGERWLTFPRGKMRAVREVLVTAGHNLTVADARENGVPVDAPDHRRVLYAHQEKIVDAAVAAEQGIIRSGTGSGKTSALIAIASRISVPTLVIVHSRALYDQWAARLGEELGLRPKQIGEVRGGKMKLKPITLGVWKSVEKAALDPEFRGYFGCLLMDEVHLAAAKSFFAAVDPMPARYRIGASADERRTDRKEFLIHDLFGDLLADITREELIESGHVLDVEVRVVPTAFAAPWYGLADEDAPGDDEKKTINIVRLVKEMAEDPERNWQAIRIIRDEVAAGNQVLVMAHEREHCMRLGQIVAGMGTPTGYLLGGEESRPEFQRACEGLKSGAVRVGVGTYKAIGTGIDLPMVGVAVAVTPIAGNKQFFGQVRGRVCRTSTGKTGARLYVMLDELVYPRHIRNLLAWNATVVARNDLGEWVPARQWVKEREGRSDAWQGAG